VEPLRLEPGVNLINVAAENQGAPKETVAAERDWLFLEVVYRVPRPQILLQALELPDGSRRRIDPERPGTPLVVDVPTFRVVGAIESASPLVGADWAERDTAERGRVAQF